MSKLAVGSLCCFLSSVLLICNAELFTRFVGNPTYDNGLCASTNRLFTTQKNHVYDCLARCILSTTCYTVFYDNTKKTCYGCDVVYYGSVTPSSSIGTTHYSLRPNCPSGWSPFQRSCYILSPSLSFWEGAAVCEGYGGHAAYVETAAENEYLKAMSENHKESTNGQVFSHYIGVTDCAEEDVWRTVGTNQTATFTDFHPTEGRSVGQAVCCVLYFDNGDGQGRMWADWDCNNANYKFPTICEINVEM